ncbi:MAG: hypothetical protein K0R98_568 [Rickettsiaceae bacterium]|jgi:hypothetical protein|nr:hypothetical protein [Rickettsiaceae bacterium]
MRTKQFIEQFDVVISKSKFASDENSISMSSMVCLKHRWVPKDLEKDALDYSGCIDKTNGTARQASKNAYYGRQ